MRMVHDIPHVVILGCGFGGLAAVQALARAPVRVTLVDRTNHHLFQPLLYQVTTAGLAAPAIAAPIRFVVRKQANVTSLLGEVIDIDVDRRVVALDGGAALDYDYLVVATGVMLGEERILARTVLWAAGIQASSLGARLRTPLDRAGRVPVLP